jgi:hypothetical protein
MSLSKAFLKTALFRTSLSFSLLTTVPLADLFLKPPSLCPYRLPIFHFTSYFQLSSLDPLFLMGPSLEVLLFKISQSPSFLYPPPFTLYLSNTPVAALPLHKQLIPLPSLTLSSR